MHHSQIVLSVGRGGGCLRSTMVLLKKIGKPLETPPDYKQAYLPYEVAPTKSELEQSRRKFLQAPLGKGEHRKMVEVKDVPQNMYTYGKEGMSLPISIFKDQQDPVIGPEWTYPGIYENKIACRLHHTHELFEMERSNSFPSPWLKNTLNNHVQKSIRRVSFRMGMLNMKNMDVFHKERGASKKAGAPAAAASGTPGTPGGK